MNFKVDSNLVKAARLTLFAIMYPFGVLGLFIAFALIWTAPIEIGLIESGFSAVETVPDVSAIWSVSNLPGFALCIVCSVGIVIHQFLRQHCR